MPKQEKILWKFDDFNKEKMYEHFMTSIFIDLFYGTV